MAKVKKRRWYRRGRRSGPRGKRSFTLPLLVVAGIVPGISRMWDSKAGGLTGVTNTASQIYLGYNPTDGSRNFSNLKYGTLPIVMGILGHFLASKLGINRALGRAGIPVFRL